MNTPARKALQPIIAALTDALGAPASVGYDGAHWYVRGGREIYVSMHGVDAGVTLCDGFDSSRIRRVLLIVRPNMPPTIAMAREAIMCGTCVCAIEVAVEAAMICLVDGL